MIEKHINYPIEFCQAQVSSLIDIVVFSDESRFCMRDDSHRIWVKRGVYKDSSLINEKKIDIGFWFEEPLVNDGTSHLFLSKENWNPEDI